MVKKSVGEMRKVFLKRRNLMVDLLREVPGLEIFEPEGAFYVFPKYSRYFGKSYKGNTVKTSSDLALFLLEEGHTATVTGDAFGAPGYIRLSYATSEESIKEGINRIKNALLLLV